MLICLCVVKRRSQWDCNFSESSTRLRNYWEILRWFVNFYVGVCLCFPLFFFFSFFFFLSSLSHVYLYVIVYRDLWRIRDRKPIYRGYLRKVSLFVCCEIETLPSATFSLFSCSYSPFSNCLSVLTSLSWGVTTPQWRNDKRRDKMIGKKWADLLKIEGWTETLVRNKEEREH